MIRELLETVEHRPWPLPSRSWVMRMNWEDLLFMHWPVDASVLRSKIPPGLELDLFDGEAWIGVVPFRMADTTLRFLPTLPGLSNFCELNVRTYVRRGDRAGVWFFSLDAANRIAVRAARAWFHLPYFDAKMRCAANGEDIEYSSRRTHRGMTPGIFDASYGPRGEVYASRAGTLEHWLTERYALYACDPRGTILEGQIHHRPWPLQSAEAEVRANDVAQSHGIALPDCDPILHFARKLETVAWAPRAVEPVF